MEIFPLSSETFRRRTNQIHPTAIEINKKVSSLLFQKYFSKPLKPVFVEVLIGTSQKYF